jgi:hypothetical protein
MAARSVSQPAPHLPFTFAGLTRIQVALRVDIQFAAAEGSMRLPVCILTLVLLSTGIARGDWSTTVEDDGSAGGQKASLRGVLSSSAYVLGTCTSGGVLSLSFGYKGKLSNASRGKIYKFTMKTDGGYDVSSDARFRRPSADTNLFVSESMAFALQMIYDIYDAKQFVHAEASSEAAGVIVSVDGNVTGAKAAVTRFIKACSLPTRQAVTCPTSVVRFDC